MGGRVSRQEGGGWADGWPGRRGPFNIVDHSNYDYFIVALHFVAVVTS